MKGKTGATGRSVLKQRKPREEGNARADERVRAKHSFPETPSPFLRESLRNLGTPFALSDLVPLGILSRLGSGLFVSLTPLSFPFARLLHSILALNAAKRGGLLSLCILIVSRSPPFLFLGGGRGGLRHIRVAMHRSQATCTQTSVACNRHCYSGYLGLHRLPSWHSQVPYAVPLFALNTLLRADHEGPHLSRASMRKTSASR